MLYYATDILQEGFESLAYFILYCAGFATLISIIIFKLMIKFPYRWIKTSLSFSLNIFLAVALFSFWIVEPVICVLTATLFAVSSTYGVYNWKRIPVSVIWLKPNLWFLKIVVQLAHASYIISAMKMKVHRVKLLCSCWRCEVKYRTVLRSTHNPGTCHNVGTHLGHIGYLGKRQYFLLDGLCFLRLIYVGRTNPEGM